MKDIPPDGEFQPSDDHEESARGIPLDRLLTKGDLARLGFAERQLDRWRKHGLEPLNEVATHLYHPNEVLDALLKEREERRQDAKQQTNLDEFNEMRLRVIEELSTSPDGMTRTEVRLLFHGKKPAEAILNVLTNLETTGETERRLAKTKGRPSERWYLAKSSGAKSGAKGFKKVEMARKGHPPKRNPRKQGV